MNLSDLLLVCGVGVLSAALRTYRHPLTRKLGAICLLLATYLAGWRFSGHHAVGAACVAAWFLLPWIELLGRVRHLRLPARRDLADSSPPDRQLFPDLDELSSAVESEGFEQVGDRRWEWDDHRQFFRFFYDPKERCQAAICLVEQRGVAFYYLSYLSRQADGTTWATWNYPFSYSLRLPPHLRVRRLRGDFDPAEMLEIHREFLEEACVGSEGLLELTPDLMGELTQRDLLLQIDHNVRRGLLRRSGDGEVRYSWRGLFFLWLQLLRDIVRFS